MIDAWGYGLLALISVILPFLAIDTSRRLGDGPLPLPRRHFYVQTIAFQLVVMVVAVIAARTNDIAFALPQRPVEGFLAAVALLGIALAVLFIRWPHRPAVARTRLYEILPHDRSEMPLYVAVCAVAAVVEEVTYRGVAYELLWRLTGSAPAAAVVTAILFALGHAIQGWSSVGAIFLFALGFHLVVAIAGSLLFAIAIHFAYDLIAGIVIPRWERNGART